MNSHFARNQSRKSRADISENGTVSHFASKMPKTEAEAIEHLKSIGYFGPNTKKTAMSVAVGMCYG